MSLKEELQDLKDDIERFIPDMNFDRYDALIANKDLKDAVMLAEHLRRVARDTLSKRAADYFIMYISTPKCQEFIREMKDNGHGIRMVDHIAKLMPKIPKKKELNKFLDLLSEYKASKPDLLNALAGNTSNWASYPEDLNKLIELYLSDEFRKVTEAYSDDIVDVFAANARSMALQHRDTNFAKMTLEHCLNDDFKELIRYFDKKAPFLTETAANYAWAAARHSKLNVLKDVFMSRDFEKFIDMHMENSEIEEYDIIQANLRSVLCSIGDLISTKNNVAKDLTKLLCEYKDIGIAKYVASTISETEETTGSTELSESILSLFYSLKTKPRITRVAAGYIQIIAQETGKRTQSLIALNIYCDKIIQSLVDIYSLLEGKDSGVYAEVGQHFIEKKDNPRGLLKLGEFINREKEFLKNEESETFFPLAVIMSEMKRKYIREIKKADKLAKLNIARAYSIAKSNINEGTKENYLQNFYEGLEGVLEYRPEMINTWAKAIVDAFVKKGKKGLLKVES